MRNILLWLCLLVPLARVQAQAPPPFGLESILGTPLFSPSDVAVDGQGNIYILEDDPYFSNKRGMLTKLDPQGRYLTRIPIGKPSYVPPYSCEGTSLALDAAGNIYISDKGAGEVRKFSPTGQLLLTIRPSSWQPCNPTANPTDLTVDAAGNVYVLGDRFLHKYNALGTRQWQYVPSFANPSLRLMDVTLDPTGNACVLSSDYRLSRLDATGQLVTTMAVNQAGQYGLGGSLGSLQADAAGNFYIAISGGSPIHKFSATGAYLLSLGPTISSGKLDLALDAAGKLYAVSGGNRGFGGMLYKFEPTGPEIRHWGSWERAKHVVQNASGEIYTYQWDRQQIIKRDADGQELLRFGGPGSGNGQFEPNNNAVGGPMMGLAVDSRGNVYTLERSQSWNTTAQIQKFTGQGAFLARIRNAVPLGAGVQPAGIAVDAADNIYVSDVTTNRVYKLDQQGRLLLTLGLSGPGTRAFVQPQALATDALGFLYVADSAGTRVRVFGPRGQLLRQMIAPQRAGGYFNPTNPVGLSVAETGTVFLSHSEWDSVRVFDRSGRLLRGIPMEFGKAISLSVNPAGTRLLTQSYESEIVCAYRGGVAGPLRSQIRGRLYHDVNQDCQAQATEPSVGGVIVVAEPGHYYGLSDEQGRYTIAVDTGRYLVSQVLAAERGRTVRPTCVLAPLVRVASAGSTVSGPDFGNEVLNQPYLHVDVSSNRRRRCARNTTTVSYANDGYAAAPNAAVTVALPPEVLLISASLPYTRTAAGAYVFALGTLAANAQGQIVILDSVACGNPSLRGLTVCTKAWISPANTYPPTATWNRASVAVTGREQAGNLVRFVLRNTGAGAMTDSLRLRIYQDEALALQHRYLLPAGDSLVLRVPALRGVVRVEAEQPAGHPTQRVASSTVELRSLRVPGLPNPVMASMSPNAPGTEVAESCLPIVDSFDPNDKQVVPTGTTARHYTPTATPLTYRLRFQNTGTDDAYRVVLVDTLSAHLDVSTLRVRAASHPYRLSLTGRGRAVLTVTFAGLELPPSSRNEPASHGFVEFSVWPAAGLAPQTQIDNFADIYFDYNPPVRTNTTTNRIYDLPPVVEPTVAQAYPAVVASPALLSFAPAQGRVGTLVTLTGQRLLPPTGSPRVLFNGVAAPVLSASSTSLTVRVPAGASTGSIQVDNGDGSSRSAQVFTVYQPPTLTAVTPGEGVPGALITLTGTHFSPLAVQDTVLLGGVPALVQQASATSLQVRVPATAPSGRIRVQTLGGAATSAEDFTVWYPPTLTAFTPAKARAGVVLTLTGSNFGPAARTQVFFGPTEGAVLQSAAGSLTVRVPVGAASGPLRVTTPGGAAGSAGAFTFVPAPVISAFTPASGSVGTQLTLTGSNFRFDNLPDTVTVGGVPAVVLSSTATTAVVRVPRGAQSGRIGVAGSGGRGVSSAAFEVVPLSPAEAITLFPNPTQGAFTLDWQLADFDVEQVRVYNSLGGLVQTHELRNRVQLALNLATQAKGLYLLVLQTARGPVTKRLTVY